MGVCTPGTYRSLPHAASKIFQEEGMLMFYRGMVPSMVLSIQPTLHLLINHAVALLKMCDVYLTLIVACRHDAMTGTVIVRCDHIA